MTPFFTRSLLIRTRANRVWAMPGLLVAATIMLIVADAGLAAASSVTSIYAFDPTTEGSFPVALVAAPDGRVFGELERGPKGSDRGTVFELDPPTGSSTRWTERNIFRLPYQNVFTGPYAHILRAGNGHLFVVASDIPAATSYVPSVVWELSEPSVPRSTWTAAIRANDPHVAGAPLTHIDLHFVDSSSVLYGYAAVGSAVNAPTMVVRLAPLSTDPSRYLASVLTSVCPAIDNGCFPETLLLGADGSFYGASNSDLFRVIPPVAPGGAWVRQSLVQATDEIVSAIDRSLTLYTLGGPGLPGGEATVNKFSPPGYARSVLLDPVARKLGDSADALAQDRSGLLFGTLADAYTVGGCCGAVFRVGSQGGSGGTPLHVFSGSDGDRPEALVTQYRPDGSRVFFGFTERGGVGWTGRRSSGVGTVFEVIP